ncbi:DNA repair protein XRCC3 isoform X2 [Lampris incognitus]|uniref:DNA repair protein XRCC3 isoform X2 n=1 Tax=Lampris incognitus TaxID=2546036 RepID=UPI0024B60172|nr:DNA repair protein XRCC3 isoform X2 [Lampris incognitus]
MDWEQLEINPRIITAVKRASIKSAREILSLSGPDLQRFTRLSRSDVFHLQAAVAAAHRSHPPVTALQLFRGEFPRLESGRRLSLACPVLDVILRGGLPLSGITELAGQGGVGKSQVALQLCLSVQYPEQYGGLNSGAVYICTEDPFPIRRLQQLIGQQGCLRPEVPQDFFHSLRFSDNIYVEHAADLGALMACVTQRVPILLARGLVRLLVVDSVAALFRSEFLADEAVERSRHLLAFSATLQHLSEQYNTPVFCINQVTDALEGSAVAQGSLGLENPKVLPALGLAWANQVMVRLMMVHLQGTVAMGDQTSTPRRLEVVFAPHLARASCVCGVWKEGVRGLPDTQDS